MNHVVTWFELPVTDMSRAKAFYGAVLDSSFTDDSIDDMQFSIFDSDERAVSGMLIASDQYIPNATGAVVYLNGGKDLEQPLQRVPANGGTILMPKTAIEDGAKGHFALFLDTEGNRVGLYSPPQ
ncbi:MAG: VOC family protein [Thiotrichales bacterium]